MARVTVVPASVGLARTRTPVVTRAVGEAGAVEREVSDLGQTLFRASERLREAQASATRVALVAERVSAAQRDFGRAQLAQELEPGGPNTAAMEEASRALLAQATDGIDDPRTLGEIQRQLNQSFNVQLLQVERAQVQHQIGENRAAIGRSLDNLSEVAVSQRNPLARGVVIQQMGGVLEAAQARGLYTAEEAADLFRSRAGDVEYNQLRRRIRDEPETVLAALEAKQYDYMSEQQVTTLTTAAQVREDQLETARVAATDRAERRQERAERQMQRETFDQFALQILAGEDAIGTPDLLLAAAEGRLDGRQLRQSIELREGTFTAKAAGQIVRRETTPAEAIRAGGYVLSNPFEMLSTLQRRVAEGADDPDTVTSFMNALAVLEPEQVPQYLDEVLNSDGLSRTRKAYLYGQGKAVQQGGGVLRTSPAKTWYSSLTRQTKPEGGEFFPSPRQGRQQADAQLEFLRRVEAGEDAQKVHDELVGYVKNLRRGEAVLPSSGIVGSEVQPDIGQTRAKARESAETEFLQNSGARLREMFGLRDAPEEQVLEQWRGLSGDQRIAIMRREAPQLYESLVENYKRIRLLQERTSDGGP